MIVYRLAHPASHAYVSKVPLGPYAFVPYGYASDDDLDAIEAMAAAHNVDHGYHPGPHQDDGLDDRPNSWEFCGFATLRDLTRWFEGYLRPLGRAGFRLYMYDVPPSKVRVGRRQVLADLSSLAPLQRAA